MRKTKRSKLSKRRDDTGSKYWRTRADSAWGKYVRQKHGGRCIVGVGCSGPVNAHHLISRANLSTRHDPANGIPLCGLHHQFSHKLSAHGAPAAFYLWLQKHFPSYTAYVELHQHDLCTETPNYRAACEMLTAAGEQESL